MLVRWYQGGAFLPFFRAHAHIDTKRREPYLLEDPYKSMVRDILRLRYSLLPVWYTAFREASVSGIPVIRYVPSKSEVICQVFNVPLYHSPHYVVFPRDPKGFDIDDQYFVGGSGLLVKPVTKPDITEVDIYLPEDQVCDNVILMTCQPPTNPTYPRYTMTTLITRYSVAPHQGKMSRCLRRSKRFRFSFGEGPSYPFALVLGDPHH